MKSNQYKAMIAKHQEEVNNFPMAFAFGKEQFAQAMRKLGLDLSDTDKVCSFYGVGDIIRKSDVPALKQMIAKHNAEIKQAIADDETGEGFIFDMFDYELSNHEYGYTRDASDALAALGASWDDLENDARLMHGFKKACKSQADWYDEHN